LIQNDPDLDPLRATEEFQQLLQFLTKTTHIEVE
jgi:hypothetical protein